MNEKNCNGYSSFYMFKTYYKYIFSMFNSRLLPSLFEEFHFVFIYLLNTLHLITLKTDSFFLTQSKSNYVFRFSI